MLVKKKINVDQFSLDTKWRELMWNCKRKHFALYLKNRIKWYYYAKHKTVSPFPLHVDFEISSLCNLRCPMCYRPHRATDNDGFMDFEKYKIGIDECSKHSLYSIRLSWRGEPSIHPDLVKMVTYAKEKGIKEVSFITNGVQLTKDMSRALAKVGLDYVSISIDGMNETYEEIRAPSKFNEMVDRLRLLKEARDEFGGYPRIRTNSIWSAIKDCKAEYYTALSPYVDFLTINPDYDHSLKNTSIDPNHVCQYLFQRLTIMWDGVIPLCICDKSGEVVLGRLEQDSLYDVWHGDKMNEMRKMQLIGKIKDIQPCTKCQRSLTTQIGNQREVRKNE